MKTLFTLAMISILLTCPKENSNMKLKISVGSSTFTAKLDNNPTAVRFKAMAPLTLHMTELNGNEKYADLPAKLPTDEANPQKIENGNIMLYGAKTIVVFYKTFSTPYSYTKIGRIDDPTGLALALGSENITVKFE